MYNIISSSLHVNITKHCIIIGYFIVSVEIHISVDKSKGYSFKFINVSTVYYCLYRCPPFPICHYNL